MNGMLTIPQPDGTVIRRKILPGERFSLTDNGNRLLAELIMALRRKEAEKRVREARGEVKDEHR